MKVEITRDTYFCGQFRIVGNIDDLPKSQAEKLINRGLAKEFKEPFETKELKTKKTTKNASDKN